MPELPVVQLGRFSGPVRWQVAAADAEARRDSRNAGAAGRLGMVLQTYNQFQAAEAAYRRAHGLDPSEFDWVYLMAVAQMAQSRAADAAESFRRALALRPGDVNAQAGLGNALLTVGSFGESAPWFRTAVSAQPGRADAHFGLGRALDGLGRREEAAQALRKACEIVPAYGAAHYALAGVLRKMGDAEGARLHLAAYRANPRGAPAPDDPLQRRVAELDERPDGMVRRGTALLDSGRTKEALALHERAVRIDPSNEPAHANLVTIYTKLGELDKAEQHYRLAVALEPRHARLQNAYAALRIKQERLEEATEALGRCLEYDPRYTECHHSLAYLAERAGRKEESLDRYQRLLRIEPGYKPGRFHAGRLMLELKRPVEAEREFLVLIEPAEDLDAALRAISAEYTKARRPDLARAFATKARQKAVRFSHSAMDQSLNTHFPERAR